MNFYNPSTLNTSRICLIAISALIIPYLIIATVFQYTGGGMAKLKYYLLPLLCFLIYSIFVLNKRRQDKSKQTESEKYILISEVVISIIAVCLVVLSFLAMMTWHFEIKIFILQLAILYISSCVLIDSTKDLRGQANGVK